VSSNQNAIFARRLSARRSIFTALTCLVVAAVAVLSFLPGEDKHVLHTRGRFHSWGHLLAFATVAFFMAGTTRTMRGRVLFFIVALVFGFGIEIGEHFLFQSALEWKDVLVDALGVICGTVAAMVSAPSDENFASD
jgi:hypothetical protein